MAFLARSACETPTNCEKLQGGFSARILPAMAASDFLDLAQRLTLQLPFVERKAFQATQVRLARLLARLWEIYAELVETHGSLAAAAGQSARPVDVADFQPGATLQLGDSFARTDPRLVLAERMSIGAWAELIGGLAGAVLQAPDLARQELLALFADLDEEVLREVAARFRVGEDTDEFPAQVLREKG
jgi:hypothetical protein